MKRNIFLAISGLSVAMVFMFLIAGGTIYYFLFTTKGSNKIVQWFLPSYLESETINIDKSHGNLADRLLLQNVNIGPIEGLPADTFIKIQNLEFYISSFNPKGIHMSVDNGRLLMPHSEPILFYGDYKDLSLNLTAYSNSINIREMLDLFVTNNILKNVSGTIIGLDVYVKGTFTEPELKGEFKIEKLSHKGFSMVDAPGVFNIKLSDIGDNFRLDGEIIFKSGLISGPKTAAINLEKSKILFLGNPKEVKLDLHGYSKVEHIKINIKLSGFIDKPDLELTSQPAMPKEHLLLMLATNKTWKGAEETLSQGALSADLVKDFVDYFFFAGSGSKMAQRFGVDFSVKYDDDARGVKVKKAITEKAEISYQTEEPTSKAEKEHTNRKAKVGGEYKITDTISIGAETEINQDKKKDQLQDKQKTDANVLLKYKKEF